MADYSLLANGDGTKTNWTDQSSGTTNLFQKVDENPASPTDADFVLTSSNSPIAFLLQDMPVDAISILTCNIVVRISVSRSKSNNRQFSTVAVYQSDESTALTATCDISTATSTITNFSFTNVSLPGAVTKAAWDGARIKFNTLTGSSGSAYIYALKVYGTYSNSAGVVKQFDFYKRLRAA